MSGADTENPTLDQVLSRAINHRLMDVHTALPARVERYDPAKQEADVQPLIRRRYRDDTEEALPMVTGVPVVWPRTEKAIISLPLAKGDTVLVLFSERSLDEWVASGGQTTPADNRRHALTDGIAVPGLYPTTGGSDADADDVLIKHEEGEIRVQPGGLLALGNSAGELFDLLDQLLAALEKTYTITAIGNQPLSEATAGTFTQLRNVVGQIKGSL